MTAPADVTKKLLSLLSLLALGLGLRAAPAVSVIAPVIGPSNAAQLVQQSEIAFTAWELVMAVAWSPDGDYLALTAGDGLYLYDGQAQQRLAHVPLRALTHGLAFSPDGQRLASGSRDGVVRVWQVPTLAAGGSISPTLTLTGHRKGVNVVLFSPDGARLASGGNDAVARFWDAASGERLGLMIGGTFAVPGLAFLPGGEALAVLNGDRIRLRQVGSERILGSFAAEANMYSLALSPDGTRLVAGANDNLIRIWDVDAAFRTGVETYPEPALLHGHAGRPGTFRALVWRVVFSPDGRLLASAGGDGSVRVWDMAQQTLLLVLPAHPGGAVSLAFSPDGTRLASGGLDGVLRIWHVAP